jgi:hypothetical protein
MNTGREAKEERVHLMKALKDAEKLIDEWPIATATVGDRQSAKKFLQAKYALMEARKSRHSLASATLFEECKFNSIETGLLIQALTDIGAWTSGELLDRSIESVIRLLRKEVRDGGNLYPLALQALHKAYNAR